MIQFASLGDFARFLPGLAARVEAAQQQGRSEAAELVRQAVDATFGEYQTADTGPAPAWAPLEEATMAARQRHGFTPDEPELVTGALRHSISVTIEGETAAVGVPDAIVGSGAPGDELRNIGDVAVAQELGTDTIPQRSFLAVGGYRASAAAADAYATRAAAAIASVERI